MMRRLLVINVLLAIAPLASADDMVLGDGTPASCSAGALGATLNQLMIGVQGPGGVLTFNCGPAEHTIELSQQINLTGFVVIDGGNRITLSGQLMTRLFEVTTFNPEDQTVVGLRNITLIGGRSVTGFGGAILQRGGTSLSLDGVTMGFNFSELTGGAIASEPLTVLEVRRSNISGNGARSGGAIASSGSVLIEDSVFNQNGVPAEGGGDQQGGAIQSWGPPLVIRRSRFTSNLGRFGGAIYKRDGALEVSDSWFAGNENNSGSLTGDNRGGAIMSVGSNTLIVRSHFEGNNGGISENATGGALYLENASSCLVQDSSFEGNEAPLGGTLRLARSCTFEQVSMQGAGVGAAIFLSASVQAVFTHATLQIVDAPLMTTDGAGTAFPRFNSSVLSGDVGGFVAPTSGGGNVLLSNLTLGANGDINVGTQAALGLGPLSTTGGITKVFLPQSGSPLIDRVPTCVFNLDARAAVRPADGDGNGSALCDSGAVERQPIEQPPALFRNSFEDQP